MKTCIQSLNSGNYLVLDHSESGKERYTWTNISENATGFESEQEAVNTIKRFGFYNAVVEVCNVNYGANGG